MASIEFYVKQAEQNEQDAETAALENVRERCLRSARAWRDMAERVARTETMRAAQAAAKRAWEPEDGMAADAPAPGDGPMIEPGARDARLLRHDP
jgi:hypothetical protein